MFGATWLIYGWDRCVSLLQCPVYDLDHNVEFNGVYQTMTKQAAITVQVSYQHGAFKFLSRSLKLFILRRKGFMGKQLSQLI